MRYINLFRKICKVETTNCFVYNNAIIFAVPKEMISRTIGKDASNVKELGQILRKKIKIIEMPSDQENISQESLKKFVEDIVEPITFNRIDFSNRAVSINAGRQSKANLIGRNRAREKELEDILKHFLNISKLRIT